MKNYRKLGFESKEAQEIVSALNILLANYHVHYQKLRNFHWNVKGHDFFEVHNVFEAEYNEVKVQIDDIAERIRVFGKTPHSTLAKYLEVSDVKEVGTDFSSVQMVEHILSDFEVLLSHLVEGIERANELGDVATADMLIKMVKRTEKRHWMLSAFIQR